MFLRSDDWWEYFMMAGCYDRRARWLLKRLLGAGDCFIDGGAHIGYYALFAAACVGDEGKVYAFEPHPQTVQSLRRNVEINKHLHVEVVPMALAGSTGSGLLSLPELMPGRKYHPMLASLIRDRDGGCGFQEVPTLTLDEFISTKQLSKVSLVKLDLEGMDAIALQGARQSLRAGVIESLIIEVSDDTKETLSSTLSDFCFDRVVNLQTWKPVRDIARLNTGLLPLNILCLRGVCAKRFKKISFEKFLI